MTRATQARRPHEILGVAPDAQPEELRRAFRTLAKRYHPDSGNSDPGAAAAFAAAKEAYDVLSSPQRPSVSVPRRVRVEGRRQDPAAAALVNGVGRLAAGIGMRRGGRVVRPRIRFPLACTLDEVATGVDVEFAYAGRTWERRIAPGVRTGHHPSNEILDVGGEPHDYVLDVRVLPDRRFVPRGADLEAAVSLSVYDLVLGGSFRIAGLAGTQIDLVVPPGFGGGTLVVSGAGLPKSPGAAARGDVLVSVRAVMPGPPSDVERDLLLRLKAAGRA